MEGRGWPRKMPSSRIFIRGALVLVALSLLSSCHRLPERAPTKTVVSWQEVSGWPGEDPGAAIEALAQSCRVLGRRAEWQEACSALATLDAGDSETVRRYFEERFLPLQVRAGDGSPRGLITGYYVPELEARRQQDARYRYPLYSVPDDLLVIDLDGVYPELDDYRLRGRREGRRIVPYYSRAEIDHPDAPLADHAFAYVEDPVELFFLHIQGSGRIRLPGGERVLVNYAEQNGHPYRSLGRELFQSNELPREQLSMQGIKAWAKANPGKVQEYLNRNPSYIFFRELPAAAESPPGSLGVPLTSGRSLAVDRRVIPLGAPVFLATTWPESEVPLLRLMVAQDTGGAIKGPVRADFFWGMGESAGEYAGRMKESGRMWVLLPKESAAAQGTDR